MFPVGAIITPRIDAGIGTNRDRYTARVEEVSEDKVRIVDARWYDINGVSHDLRLANGEEGEWVNPESYLSISDKSLVPATHLG